MDLPDGVAIRAATPEDAEALTHLHLDCWDDAYTGLIEQAVLDARRADMQDAVARRRAWLVSGNEILLATNDEELIGFANAGAGRDHAFDIALELRALYVRAAWWGTGVGHALCERTVGDGPAYLWVLEGNDRAIGFYERQGFLRDGSVRDELEGQNLRMVRHSPPHFDLSDPSFDVTSTAVHDARDRSWYAVTNWGWAILRYDEVNELLKDRRFRQGNARWPAQNGIHFGRFSDWWQETLLSLEGDDHARLRRLLMPAFRNKAIAAMRPRFQDLANELIDGFADRGEVEFVSEFAEPYASRIICVLLGLPEDDWPQVAHWADDLGKSFGINVAADLPRIEAALDGLYGYVDRVIAARQAAPRDDLVTTLLHAQEADGRLTRHELGVALVFLAFAGMETTRNQLGLALRTMLGHPDQWRLLAERPELGAQAVEEVMRVNPTVTWVTREAIEDVEYHGLHIPQGGIVQMLSHAAGTDPAAMPDPSFDITAVRPPHMGFGSGVHHCLGHFVARTDMAVALPLLARRMLDAEPDGPGEWLPVSGNTGPVEFPIRFTG